MIIELIRDDDPSSLHNYGKLFVDKLFFGETLAMRTGIGAALVLAATGLTRPGPPPGEAGSAARPARGGDR